MKSRIAPEANGPASGLSKKALMNMWGYTARMENEAAPSRNYKIGYDQAIESLLSKVQYYSQPENDYQRGWNAGVKASSERAWPASIR